MDCPKCGASGFVSGLVCSSCGAASDENYQGDGRRIRGYSDVSDDWGTASDLSRVAQGVERVATATERIFLLMLISLLLGLIGVFFML